MEAVEIERDAQKETKSAMKATLDSLNEDVQVYARKVNRHVEDREVKIDLILNPDTQKIYETRLDTGEVVLERKAEPDELQDRFQDEGGSLEDEEGID